MYSWIDYPQFDHPLVADDLEKARCEIQSFEQMDEDEEAMYDIFQRKPNLQPSQFDADYTSIVPSSDWILPGTTALIDDPAPTQTLPVSSRLLLIRSSSASRVPEITPPSGPFPDDLWEAQEAGTIEYERLPPTDINIADALMPATIAAGAQEAADTAKRQAELAEAASRTAQMLEAPGLPPAPVGEDDNDMFMTPPSRRSSSPLSSPEVVVVSKPPPPRRLKNAAWEWGVKKTAEQEFQEVAARAVEEANSSGRITRTSARRSSEVGGPAARNVSVDTPVPKARNRAVEAKPGKSEPKKINPRGLKLGEKVQVRRRSGRLQNVDVNATEDK